MTEYIICSKPYEVYRINPDGSRTLLGKFESEPDAVELRELYGLGVYEIDALQGVYGYGDVRGGKVDVQIFPKRIVVQEIVFGQPTCTEELDD